MTKDYCILEYDIENESKNWTSPFCEHISFNDELRKNKIEEFAKEGLYFYSITKNYFIDNKLSLEDIRQKCISSKNVLFCHSSNLPMGYFCSSPIFDLITGKTKRGKIHRKPLGTKHAIKYYFCNNKLIFAECNDSTETFLFYDDSQKAVHEFMLINNNLLELTVCKYDDKNRIIKRTTFSHRTINQDILKRNFLGIYSGNKPIVIRDFKKRADYLFTINEEKYIYESDRIVEAILSDFSSFMPDISCNKYIFRYIGDYYSDYDFINCHTENKNTYKVYVKRKYFEFIHPPEYSYYATKKESVKDSDG